MACLFSYKNRDDQSEQRVAKIRFGRGSWGNESKRSMVRQSTSLDSILSDHALTTIYEHSNFEDRITFCNAILLLTWVFHPNWQALPP